MSPAITQVFPAAAASLARFLARYVSVSLFSLGIAVCANENLHTVALPLARKRPQAWRCDYKQKLGSGALQASVCVYMVLYAQLGTGTQTCTRHCRSPQKVCAYCDVSGLITHVVVTPQ